MTYIDNWWENVDSSSCIPYDVWNELIDYISCPTSASTGFTIYSDCSNQNEPIFKFDYTGTVSRLYGGDDTGDDMQIFANSFDADSSISLLGNSNIEINVNEALIVNIDFNEHFRFDSSRYDSTISGTPNSGDALLIEATSVDANPYILLVGDDYIIVNTSSYIEFDEDEEQMFLFTLTGSESSLFGSNDTGDDLWIFANSYDNCPVVILEGNNSIKAKFNYTGIFEISTCSNEKFFTCDPVNQRNDHHCMDAYNFVVECRTADPSSGTCTGQLWFRTDLV